MMPISTRIVAPLISMKVTATSRVGAIRVRPVSTTKVRKADSSATATANGASHLRKGPLLDSANDGSNDGADESALVIPAMGSLKTPARRDRCPAAD